MEARLEARRARQQLRGAEDLRAEAMLTLLLPPGAGLAAVDLQAAGPGSGSAAAVDVAAVALAELRRRPPKLAPRGVALLCAPWGVVARLEPRYAAVPGPPRAAASQRLHLELLLPLLLDAAEWEAGGGGVLAVLVARADGARVGISAGPFHTTVGQLSLAPLPRKHGRGGSSVLRFRRLYMERLRRHADKYCALAREALAGVDFDGLLVVGPRGDIRQRVFAALDDDMAARVLHVSPLDRVTVAGALAQCPEAQPASRAAVARLLSGIEASAGAQGAGWARFGADIDVSGGQLLVLDDSLAADVAERLARAAAAQGVEVAFASDRQLGEGLGGCGVVLGCPGGVAGLGVAGNDN